jgi:predicted nucleic acid-binding protein
MPMGVVVDSSIFIAAERGRFDWRGFHEELYAEPLFVTVITLSELLHGAERADSPDRRSCRLAFIADVETRYPLLIFGRSAAAEYAHLWAALSRQGNVIGTHDMQIAAIARVEGCRVATLNADEFVRVPGLEVTDASAHRLPAAVR